MFGSKLATLYAYEDGTDSKFRNVGTESSRRAITPKRNTAFNHGESLKIKISPKICFNFRSMKFVSIVYEILISTVRKSILRAIYDNICILLHSYGLYNPGLESRKGQQNLFP